MAEARVSREESRPTGQLGKTPKVYVGRTEGDLKDALSESFDYVGLSEVLSKSRTIFLKPNFTFPRPVEGVTTSREILQTTLSLLVEMGAEVFVGESNGGYGSFTAEEAFRGQGLYKICKQAGAHPLNLSKMETQEYTRIVGGREVSVRLPRFLVDNVDMSISMPVLKVHAMTTVSLSIKNLWGCYPTDLRLLEHRELDRKLALIRDLINAKFGIVDATYALDEHGPMDGKAREIGKFMTSDELLALDIACARMMGFNPQKINHLQNLSAFIPHSAETLTPQSNVDLSRINWRFKIRRNFIDSLSFACFHNDLLAKIVFDSPLTLPIYATLGRKPRRKLA